MSLLARPITIGIPTKFGLGPGYSHLINDTYRSSGYFQFFVKKFQSLRISKRDDFLYKKKIEGKLPSKRNSASVLIKTNLFERFEKHACFLRTWETSYNWLLSLTAYKHPSIS